MVNLQHLSLAKEATVAIGLVDNGGTIPKQICGTGFVLNENRYLMTAAHVMDECYKWYEIFKKKNEKTEIVAFNTLITESELKFKVLPLDAFSDHSFARSKLLEAADGYAGPNDIDISIGKFLHKHNDLPFLEIKKPEEPNLYDEIAMCGYPSGDQSLDLQRRFSGIRFSPTIQFGKVVGFLPSDNSPQPYGMQTDIVGTRGSSGSPIIGLDDGKVVGIAQQVILAGVKINNDSVYGTAKIGLVNGVTNHMFYKLSENVAPFLEKGEKLHIKVNTTHFGKSTIDYQI